jgi:flagellar assembly protein FliH
MATDSSKDVATSVESFKVQDFGRSQIPSYQKIKSGFKKEFEKQTQRFSLSEHVANQLSVEREEQERFDRKVKGAVEDRVLEIKDEARKQGYAEGFDSGQKKAFDEEKARLAALMERLATLVSAMGSAKERMGEQYEKMLIDFGFRLAKILVHKQVSEQPETVAASIRAIIDRVAKEDDLRIRLSAIDFEAITAIEKELGDVARVGRIFFEVDHSLQGGDCIVECPSGEITSVMDEKFSLLKDEVMRNHSRARHSGVAG